MRTVTHARLGLQLAATVSSGAVQEEPVLCPIDFVGVSKHYGPVIAIDEALSLSGRIVVLDYGRMQQTASTQEAYLRPASRFVTRFSWDGEPLPRHQGKAPAPQAASSPQPIKGK